MVENGRVTPVPVIDISQPSSSDLSELDRACRDHGFFLIAGHGLDALIDRTWEQTHRFFDAPRSVRLDIMRSADQPLGWFDRELTKRRRDHKEVFDFVDPQVGDSMNRWPSELPGFRDVMVEFFDAFSDLATRTCSLVLDALGVDPGSRTTASNDRHSSTVRLNLYTVGDPVPADEREGLPELGATALGHHTDPGVLTLLLQDDTGGLQAESTELGWIDVPPIPGTVVVNMGDCMQARTNDQYRAAVHRVLPMDSSRRFSIPYFANPSRDAIIEPLAALSADGPRYRPFPWREFMAARAYDNFQDLGVEDTQVTDFRID